MMIEGRVSLLTFPGFVGGLLAVFFALLPMLSWWLGHPTLCLWFSLIGLPLLEMAFQNYRGPLPYWSFWSLRVLLFLMAVQAIVGAFVLATYSWWILILGAIGSGYCAGGSGNALGHELGHSLQRWDRFLAKSFFTSVCFGHYTQEHAGSHHVVVGTPKDSLYTEVTDTLTVFMFRNMKRQFQNAVEVAKRRNNLWAEVYGPLVVYGLINVVVAEWVGFKGVVFLTIQTITVYAVDASITFIQHWSLHRTLLENGRYERVGPEHTWDCTNWITNVVSFSNCRHADHHLHPGRNLNEVEQVPESPQLPYGYAVMGTLANAPVLFRTMMQQVLSRS
jgi:alkane 1-monooxygenase